MKPSRIKRRPSAQAQGTPVNTLSALTATAVGANTTAPIARAIPAAAFSLIDLTEIRARIEARLRELGDTTKTNT